VSLLSNMSLKKRRQAARQWSQWRNEGVPAEITAGEALYLTGLDWYSRLDERTPVRLTEAALRLTASKKGTR
jgi:hypothetical protein